MSTPDRALSHSRARFVDVDGVVNLRDLGGYRGHEGRTVRWGMLFRSDDLARVTDRGLAQLRPLRLRLLCDLRDAAARERRPHRAEASLGARIAVLPIEGDAAMGDLTALLARSRDPEHWTQYTTTMYRQLVSEAAPALVSLVELLATPSALPAAFHCTGGKDRTGLAAAVALSILGVDDESILDDYELSTRPTMARIAAARPAWESQGIAVDAVMPVVTAPRFALQAALAHIAERFGGVWEYLLAHGATPSAADRLRDALLEP